MTSLLDRLYSPIGYLDRGANKLEDRLVNVPVLRYATYQVSGDASSWLFSHPAFVLLGAAIGWIFGHPLLGAKIVTAIYVPREIVDGYRNWKRVGWAGAFKRLPVTEHRGWHVGWLIDGVMDVVGPIMTTLLIWWLV